MTDDEATRLGDGRGEEMMDDEATQRGDGNKATRRRKAKRRLGEGTATRRRKAKRRPGDEATHCHGSCRRIMEEDHGRGHAILRYLAFDHFGDEMQDFDIFLQFDA